MVVSCWFMVVACGQRLLSVTLFTYYCYELPYLLLLVDYLTFW
jgi:hypothetical protein